MHCRLSVILAATLLVALAAVPAISQDAEKKDAPAASPAPAAAPAAAAPAAAPAPPMAKAYKVICDGKAKNDGVVQLVFTPQGGAPKSITVTVQKKMDRKDVCKDLAKELAVGLGADYKVDHYDADKIKVEGKNKQMFSLAIGSQTATNLNVTLKQD